MRAFPHFIKTGQFEGASMTRYLSCFFLFLALMVSAVYADAAVEWESGAKLNIGGSPKDIAVSSDGKLTFILTTEGKVMIFSADGSLENSITVKGSVETIDISPDGSKLYLGDKSAKTLETINIDFVYNINTVGSPYTGPADAPVVVTVFSDFQ